jgi:fibronectin type 3 domain-containing protein
VSLDWTPGSSSFAGFNVYRGSLSGGPYTKVNSVLISTTSFIDTSVASGQTYHYVATEVDSTGAESPYSSETSAGIP